MPDSTPVTKLVDIEADEGVHGVTSPANGMSFLLIKQLDDTASEGLTDEQALAKALDDYGRWVKAKYTQDQVDALGKKGQALKNPDGHYSYPIADTDDLANAIKAVGRGGADHDNIRAYVIKRAKALGASDQIPDSWGSDGSLSKDTSFLSMTNPGGAGDTTDPSAGGDATVPGSPAWEAQDADALMCAGQALAQIAQMLQCSADREQMEVATGHADDIADVYDLQDALCYVQNALGIVARVAFTEQAEAGGDGMSKAVESLTALQKQVTDLLGAAGGHTSATGAELKGDIQMDITEDQLTEMVSKAAADAVAKAEADRKAAKAEKKAAQVAKSTETAPEGEETGETAGETSETVTKQTGNEDDLAARLGAVVKETVDAAVAPLKEQVDAISKQAAPGGPLASATAARAGNPTLDLSGLQEKFEKATDPIEKADLGERITRMKYLARLTGQDVNPAG